jgi:2-polyprenyl-3-methyl-5-hydroxy-6-metoxy-1,4-benzoquinol methylase
MNEIEKLQKISVDHGYSNGVMAASIASCYGVLSRYLRGPEVLELGPAEGLMTELLVKTGYSITVVEGSKKYCDSIEGRFEQVCVFHSLFEDFQPVKRFDTIILGHVLEHVADPTALLIRAKTWLKPDGKIFGAVPNADSLHRQAAVLMGLLAQVGSLNEADLLHGHRRVFNPTEFKDAFRNADLKIDFFGGYWLKPLSNGQIEKDWTPEMISAFMLLGERYPEIAGEIYILAS